MLVNISDYQVTEKIYDGLYSQVYRGFRQHDNLPVILKVLTTEFPTSQLIGRYKLEYKIIKSLDSDFIINAYDLKKHQNGYAIILEDFGGETLAKFLTVHKLSLVEFLELAIQISESVYQIHAANVIHKDINPANIIFNSVTNQLKIIDFGIASALSKETLILDHNQLLEGTLGYISPEQTGRMNRSLDYRTDIYSMGVTFYQMLTERLPFESNDPLELIHHHLALEPIAPHLINSQIPLILSQIILKLLAKTAEERYQSVCGLKVDLQKCLNQLQTEEKIEPFELAEQDIADKFLIPEKLYGRAREVDSLLTAFSRIADSKSDRIEIVLVSGYSGIGKSRLVKEIHKPIAKSRGYFISGKFEQYQRNIPYLGIIQAFQGLINQLLTESEDSLERWRSRLIAALGTNSHIIMQVIPSLEMIIGQQSNNSAISINISANEAQNRFNRVFKNFIQVFAQLEHPLVIFLDDLQWADLASIKLLELISISSEKKSLLLIGAYRDNEVNAAHPLQQTINNIHQKNVEISQLSLVELALKDINQLIADTLHCSKTDALPLAELVLQKTSGNPFFINEFLKALYEEELLRFDYQSCKWQWSIAQIQVQKITDNVVNLMAGKIQKLGDRSQQLLQIAACIGNQFDLDTLVLVSELSYIDSVHSLREAIIEGLILPLNDTHQSVCFGIELTSDRPAIGYKFVHDRIQQAAHLLISDGNQAEIHQRIGQQLLKSTDSSELEAKIFDIVNQLNFGVERISSQTERNQLAQLNLIASQKAKASTAYSAAFEYAKIGVELLGNESWQSEDRLSLELYQLAIETAFLNGDFPQIEKWAVVIFNHAENLLDKVKVYEIQIQSLVGQNQRLESIRIGINTLKLLGIELPIQASQSDVALALQDFQTILVLYRVDALLELPLMADAIALASINILLSIAAAAYVASPELYILVVLQIVKMSIAKGNAQGSTYGYAACGLIFCGLMSQIELGFQFGQLALRLLNRFESQELTAKTLIITNVFINHWKHHLRETLQPLLSCYTIGVETGDFEFAAYGLCLYSHHLYFLGRELGSLEQQISNYETLISQLNQQTTLDWLRIYHQGILNLLGSSQDPCRLIGEIYNADTMQPIHRQTGDRSSLHMLHLNQLILCYLFENYDQAINNASQVAVYKDAAIGLKSSALSCFYDTLARLANYPNLDAANREETMARVVANQEEMKLWADHAPMNYQHQWQLIEAERFRVLAQVVEAMEAYDLAIAGARENGYIQEEGLANELAAKFYLAQNRITISKAYIKEARYCYLQWGALAKVQHLENRYPEILEIISTDQDISKSSSPQLSSSNLKVLDLEAVFKSSQAIAREIQLDSLLASLMAILIENAGAKTGYLILPTNLLSIDEWRIEAIKSVNDKNIAVMQSIPIDQISADGNFYVPVSLINYVARTQEMVVLNNAAQIGDFQNDPWIEQYQSKSILCMPLLNQGNLTAIVLLENNLATDAFTPQRIEVLNLLSAQAAISIIKARLLKQQDELNKSLQAEIRDRQLAEKERDRLIAIIEASTDIIGMSSPQGQVLWNNAQANKVQGLSPDADLSSLNIPTYHPQWALEIIQSQGIPAAIRDGTWVGETAFLTSDGSEIPVSQMIIAHKSANGDLEYLSTIMRDISTLKAIESEVRQLNADLENRVLQRTAQLESANKELESFSYSVSHDLRAPLRAINGFSKILLEDYGDRLDAEGSRYLKIVRDNAKRMGELIDDLLNLSRLNRKQISRRPISVNNLIQQTLSGFNSEIEERQIELIVADLPECQADISLLTQVWINLLSNAVKYTSKTENARIEIGYQLINDEIAYFIRDNGAGFDMQYADKLFGVFQRMHLEHEFEGTGIGLAIVQRIIQRHGGRIWADASVNQGSVFYFTIPN